MKQKSGFESFFTNDLLLTLLPILFVVFEVLSEIFYVRSGWFNITYTIERVFIIGCLITLAVSYKKHAKNIMKPMMGALLAASFFCDLPLAVDMLSNGQWYYDNVGDVWAIYEILVIFSLMGYLAILIFHMIINSDHHSSPAKVKINQIIIILVMVVYVGEIIISLFINRSVSFMLAKICCSLANIALLDMIIAIESKLDLFRQAREANGYVPKN